MTDILTIKDLRVEGRPPGGNYVPIVKGVSMSVAKGEVLALIGESGSGKSTISLASMGFARPGCRISGGEVWLNGRDIMKLPPRDRHSLRGDEVSYVAQSAAASFNPALRIGKQVVEAPLWHGTGDAETLTANAIELYRKLDLPAAETVGDKFPHQVSGGQLQRLMAAMAMSCGPDLLILDEPTTALDVTTQIEVLKAFKDIIRDQGTAAIYVTHDLAVVSQVADRILVLKNGEMVEEGTTDQILHHPQHEYTRTLMEAVRPAPHLVDHVETDLTQRPVISARNVTAGYGALTILSDVSVDVPAASVVGVIGESGCGKSTLARVVAGLTPLKGGEVQLDGNTAAPAVKDRSIETLKDCQIVFQMADTALNPRQRISDILGRPLEFYLNLKGRARAQKVGDLLELVDLPRDFASRYPGELSGGQKQRINLARALAAEPKVILCDEVTSALDTVVAAGVIELLKSLKDKLGVAYMFISHDLSTVASFADEVVVLYAGRVVEKGPSKAVFRPPFHPYTKLLLSSVPEMRQGWLEGVADTSEAKAASAGSVEIGARGCPFANRCTHIIAGTCDTRTPPLHDLPGGLSIACHLTQTNLPLD
ncbi:ABC transporter ATP-binding protein [Ruegeria faecimaris]|uniref:Peptide/nickel transport system ATP-binding protein n=1 Tax=Ruegeria faecimaris TaxID=686389 RepID=A0A521ELS0_9RHOB|nr:ABC transporter ATP-binding protein [Ruegeria faecimaris]SMO84070.1 peptide/nickel transport system ATP-binding protein [Ruegeria faecimaris]